MGKALQSQWVQNKLRFNAAFGFRNTFWVGFPSSIIIPEDKISFEIERSLWQGGPFDLIATVHFRSKRIAEGHDVKLRGGRARLNTRNPMKRGSSLPSAISDHSVKSDQSHTSSRVNTGLISKATLEVDPNLKNEFHRTETHPEFDSMIINDSTRIRQALIWNRLVSTKEIELDPKIETTVLTLIKMNYYFHRINLLRFISFTENIFPNRVNVQIGDLSRNTSLLGWCLVSRRKKKNNAIKVL